MNTFKRKMLCLFLLTFLVSSLPAQKHITPGQIWMTNQIIHQQATRALTGLMAAGILFVLEYDWKYYAPFVLMAFPCVQRRFFGLSDQVLRQCFGNAGSV